MSEAKILVVDDERNIADLIAIILQHHGYDTAACYTAAQAAKRAAECAPRLVIMDVVLPDADGIDCALNICRQLPDVDILVLSGQADTRELEAQIQPLKALCPRATFLSKPVHPDDLLREIAAFGL
ncbi:MAG: response regulator [Terriglobales bacterium]